MRAMSEQASEGKRKACEYFIDAINGNAYFYL